MRPLDQVGYVLQHLMVNRVRSFCTLLAMAIGSAGVVLLTWLGDSGRHYVLDQFGQLGSELVIVLPGRNETTGGAPPMFGETPEDLTLEDALALNRHSDVTEVAPVQVGSAIVRHGSLAKETVLLGSTAALQHVRRLRVAHGTFLPHRDAHLYAPVCVLGHRIATDVLGTPECVGKPLRIEGRRFVVVGVLADEGRSLGTDLQDVVIVPVAATQQIFDSEGMFRILVAASSRAALPAVATHVEQTIGTRHHGAADVTVITQESVVRTFDRILQSVTLAVGGIAAISLLVAGVLVMNVTWIDVAQRRGEIGLLRALGASRAIVRRLFVLEAVLLSLSGSAVGAGMGILTSNVLADLHPALRTSPPSWAIASTVLTAVAVGAIFSAAPAQRAARMRPIEALAPR